LVGGVHQAAEEKSTMKVKVGELYRMGLIDKNLIVDRVTERLRLSPAIFYH
jgi:hypothetical protein